MVTVSVDLWERREEFYPSWRGLGQMIRWVLTCMLWHADNHVDMVKVADGSHIYVCEKCDRMVVLHA